MSIATRGRPSPIMEIAPGSGGISAIPEGHLRTARIYGRDLQKKICAIPEAFDPIGNLHADAIATLSGNLNAAMTGDLRITLVFGAEMVTPLGNTHRLPELTALENTHRLSELTDAENAHRHPELTGMERARRLPELAAM